VSQISSAKATLFMSQFCDAKEARNVARDGGFGVAALHKSLSIAQLLRISLPMAQSLPAAYE
jgi:hypothetical protein